MFRGPFLNLMRYLNKQTKTFLAFVSLKSRMEERAGEKAQICFYYESVNRNYIWQSTCKRAIRKKKDVTRHFCFNFSTPLSQGWSKDVTVRGASPSPSTNVVGAQVPATTPYSGWVCCWFSPLLREVFLRVLWLSSLLKNQYFRIQIWPKMEDK